MRLCGQSGAYSGGLPKEAAVKQYRDSPLILRRSPDPASEHCLNAIAI
jgi:hypothetical protein